MMVVKDESTYTSFSLDSSGLSASCMTGSASGCCCCRGAGVCKCVCEIENHRSTGNILTLPEIMQ